MGRARCLIALDLLEDLFELPVDARIEAVAGVMVEGVHMLEIEILSPQLREASADLRPPLITPKLERIAPRLRWTVDVETEPGTVATRDLGDGRRRL